MRFTITKLNQINIDPENRRGTSYSNPLLDNVYVGWRDGKLFPVNFWTHLPLRHDRLVGFREQGKTKANNPS